MNFFQRLLIPKTYSLVETRFYEQLLDELSECRREIERKNRDARISSVMAVSSRNAFAMESLKLIHKQEIIDRLEKELKLLKEKHK